ncbi:MAG: phosphoribosylamine--glycine ligase, partial [Neomegalonema sp.]|nr:phosphoribosylamine--glycine ligase [Neomegalonema sp.]
MRILLLGGGGREHALAWALSKSARVEQILWAPGNGARLPKVENRVLNANDPAAVAACVRDQKIDFVVIGPEAPLEAGVSDVLIEAGVPVFGPSKAAAMLEVSKSFTKEICDACGAPTAGWKRFDAAEPALAYLEQTGAPIVVKADGLAAGKGVTVAETLQQARDAVNAIFAGGAQGAVVIEEFLEGEEASLFAFVSGEEIRVFACAQDHKRVFEGDQGPNTGGMGAYSPAPVADAELQARAVADILQPVMREMVKRGAPYHGIIFAGLMIKDGAPKLIEFNARFGDPEAQTLLPLLQSDLLPLLLACAAHGDKLNAPS